MGSVYDDLPPFSLSIQGLEGTGKTTFLLSMPTPITLVNFGDRPCTPLLYRIPEERRKQITVVEIHPNSPDGWTFPEAMKALETLGKTIRTAFEDTGCRTFAIDGASRWWRAMQVVFVEPKEQERLNKGLKQIGGIIYEEANMRFDGIMSWLRRQNAWIAVTHVLKQDWDDKGPIPGSFSPRQNNQVPFIVEVVLELSKRCAACGAPDCQTSGHVGRKHSARLLKFAADTSLEGLVVDDPTFEKIARLWYGPAFAGGQAGA